jgi:hypothetical protein
VFYLSMKCCLPVKHTSACLSTCLYANVLCVCALCSPELKALASRLAARAAAADPGRVAEERKKRNYADFWTPIAANEPFRVVLSHMRDRCGCSMSLCAVFYITCYDGHATQWRSQRALQSGAQPHARKVRGWSCVVRHCPLLRQMW